MKPPFIPDDAPFTGDQKSWLAGFLAGLQSAKQMADQQNASLTATAGQVAPRLDILYGSQTGNAEGIAIDAANMARSQGFNPVVQGMDDVSLSLIHI